MLNHLDSEEQTYKNISLKDILNVVFNIIYNKMILKNKLYSIKLVPIFLEGFYKSIVWFNKNYKSIVFIELINSQPEKSLILIEYSML